MKKLFEDFPPIPTEDWLNRLSTELKGKTFEDLSQLHLEGIVLPPFQRASDAEVEERWLDSLPGTFPFRRGNAFNQPGDDWQIVQELAVDSSQEARKRLEEANEAGIQAVKLYSWEGNGGKDAFLPVLESVDSRYNAVHLYASYEPLDILQGLYTHLDAQGHDPADLTGTLTSLAVDVGDVSREAILEATAPSPYFRGLGIDMSVVDENGGTLTQQLAFALSKAVDWITDTDAPRERILNSLVFTFPIGSEFLLELAKLRAFRILFARVLEIMGETDPQLMSPFIIAQSARWNKTHYDAHTNLLRTTTEAISAILGGAHAVVVSSHEKLNHPEQAFPARLARNIQLILKHESFLGQVTDPAGGAYYLEYLTDQLAANAWKLFQELESAGGYDICLDAGMIDELLGAAAQQRLSDVATRKRVFVGVNNYPAEGDDPNEVTAIGEEGPSMFEHLRLRMDRFVKETGERPSVFLLSYGNVVMRNARMNFTRNLMGCGGFAFQENPHPEDFHTALAAMAEAAPAAVVLCGADRDYTEGHLAQVRAALPGKPVWVAGKSTDALPADGFLYRSMNAVSAIEGLQDKVMSETF